MEMMRYLLAIPAAVRAFARARLGLRLALMNFFLNMAMESSNVFMPLYAKDHGASNLQVGFIAAAFGLSFFVSSIFSGRQSDIHGRLIFVRAGLIISIFAYIAQMFAPNPVALIAVRGAVGFGVGLISAAVMAYTYENQKQIGRFASYGAAGWLFGALLGAAFKNYYALFAASAATSGLALLVSLTFKEGPRMKVSGTLFPLISANRKIYLAFFLRQLGTQAVWAIFPLYLAGIGASKLWIALMDAINMGAQFTFMRLVERFNPALMFRFGLLLSAIVFGIYGLANNYLQLLPIQVILGLAWSCIFVGSLGYLLRTNVERGSVSGLIYSTTYLSGGIGPFMGGAVSQAWGYGTLMYISSGMALASFAYSHGLALRQKKPSIDKN